MMDLTEILAGVAFLGFCLWDIRDGRSSLMIGRWWTWLHFERSENPFMFWLCITIEFAIGAFAIVDGCHGIQHLLKSS